MAKKRKIVTAILLALVIVLCIIGVALDWSVILVWETYSVLTAFISAVLLIAGVTWFIYSYRYKD